jgi:hypothetical protein
MAESSEASAVLFTGSGNPHQLSEKLHVFCKHELDCGQLETGSFADGEKFVTALTFASPSPYSCTSPSDA